MANTLVYQLYPLSWQTGFGGMSQHLRRIAALGVDYIWLSPIFRSPLEDGGYDVSNYLEINSRFARTHDPFRMFETFVDRAHQLGIGVLLDLPINHTSIRHRWFDIHPEYYCWSTHDRPDWHNLFNQGPAWKYLEDNKRYYLHLFHETMPDLNWFPGGELNAPLVDKFQEIVDFWVENYQIDGFRLDFPQGINKDFMSDTLELEQLFFGDKAVDVISAIFEGREDLFLLMECFDPTYGELISYYADNTPVDFVMNVMTKDQISQGESEFLNLVKQQAHDPHFMLELESHDSPRFPSRGVNPEDMIWYLLNSGAEGVCLYQGQELGLYNPTKSQLPDEQLLKLDAQTAMRYIKGENLDDLRPISRANARIRLPLDEYARQEQNPSSYLNLTLEWIDRWRNS